MDILFKANGKYNCIWVLIEKALIASLSREENHSGGDHYKAWGQPRPNHF